MTKSYQWIKLYIEILDDYKMFQLPNHLWRRAVELFLVAGRSGSGKLGPVPEMAFWLHDTEKNIEESLRALEAIGIVSRAESGTWIVTNFSKRQSKIEDKDRQAQYRDRLRNALLDSYDERNVSVTTRNKHSPENREEENREEKKEEEAAVPPLSVNGLKQGDLRLEGQSTYPEWPLIPDARTAERVFQLVTGMVTFPSRGREQDIERICSLYDRFKAGTVEELHKYYQAWLGRNYSKVNTGWLDWAVAGQIPVQRGKNGSGKPADIGDPALKDPVIREAVGYLRLNPKGTLREKNLERLKAKGFTYANNQLTKLVNDPDPA